MASAAQPVPTATCTPAIVGNAFVHQYYHILHQSPELVHRFYQDISKLGRPEENGVMSSTSNLQAIDKKILSFGFGVNGAEITTVDTQESYSGGVLVLVTGYLTGKDNVTRKFTQTFFLAPQEKGYFVLNDMFRFVNETKISNGNEILANDIQSPVIPHQDQSVALEIQEDHVQEKDLQGKLSIEQPDVLSKDVDIPEVINPSENGHVSTKEEVSTNEDINEVPCDLQKVPETNSRTKEVPKRSYASIVKVMKENAAPVSTSRPHANMEQKRQEQQVVPASPPIPHSGKPDPGANANANGNNPDAVGPSIYVKGLPLDATPVLLENEFKRFGPIRNNGIQVRSQKTAKQGFCFGFVEFEAATSMQSAIEASPIVLSGYRVVVEEKRSTSRVTGNNRGRSLGGSGNRARGYGNYGGGRGYGRGDFNHRDNYKGGYGNRGVTGGGRVSRDGGVGVKSMAPRVTATA